MRLVKAAAVQRSTGLTADQLREWTARRGLIAPDVKPCGPGSRAGYGWQTVLLLRVAVVLKETFHVELQAQRPLFTALKARLATASFPALRGLALLVRSGGQFDLIAVDQIEAAYDDVLVIRLDPHLDVLSTGFGFIEHADQLPLFPAVAVR